MEWNASASYMYVTEGQYVDGGPSLLRTAYPETPHFFHQCGSL
jgi:hypothetical protein